jgi:enoyl-CoA hydratase
MITTSYDKGVAIVEVNRPPVNAMNRALFAQLRDTFRTFDENAEVKVVLLVSGCERAFLAGADMKERLELAANAESAGPTTGSLDPRRFTRECLWAIQDCAVPVVAAVNGPALGAGLIVVASCDIVIASERASFGLPEIDVGLLGGTPYLARLIGSARMRKAFFTAERLDARQMLDLGAISDVVPSEQLAAAALGVAHAVAAKSAVALRLAKEYFNRTEGQQLKAAYLIEQDYTGKVVDHGDSRQGMQAFLARHPISRGNEDVH